MRSADEVSISRRSRCGVRWRQPPLSTRDSKSGGWRHRTPQRFARNQVTLRLIMPTTTRGNRRSMKAATIARYGSPGAIEVRDVPAPVPGPGEVLRKGAVIPERAHSVYRVARLESAGRCANGFDCPGEITPRLASPSAGLVRKRRSDPTGPTATGPTAPGVRKFMDIRRFIERSPGGGVPAAERDSSTEHAREDAFDRGVREDRLHVLQGEIAGGRDRLQRRFEFRKL